MKPTVPLYAVLRILGNRIEQSWKEPDERIFISTQEHFYIMSAADELSKLMEEREKLVGMLNEAHASLHSIEHGAEESRLILEAALASLEKSNG